MTSGRPAALAEADTNPTDTITLEIIAKSLFIEVFLSPEKHEEPVSDARASKGIRNPAPRFYPPQLQALRPVIPLSRPPCQSASIVSRIWLPKILTKI
jgi:hypothetical protein